MRALHPACRWRRVGPVLCLMAALLVAPALRADEPFDRCREGGQGDAVSGTALLELTSRGRDGEETRSRARLSWSGDAAATRVRLEMLAPPEIAGSALILVEPRGGEPRAWAWLPELGDVREVGARHLGKPLFGTNLRYADLERVRRLASGDDPDAWSETSYEGRRAWKLLVHDGRDTVVTWVDAERCVPMRTEISDRRGRLARLVTLSSEPASLETDLFVPHSLLVRDVLDQTETRVEVEAVDLDAALPRASFDPGGLGGGREPTPGS